MGTVKQKKLHRCESSAECLLGIVDGKKGVQGRKMGVGEKKSAEDWNSSGTEGTARQVKKPYVGSRWTRIKRGERGAASSYGCGAEGNTGWALGSVS